MKDREINGKTFGSEHEHQVRRTSSAHSDEDRRPGGIGHSLPGRF